MFSPFLVKFPFFSDKMTERNWKGIEILYSFLISSLVSFQLLFHNFFGNQTETKRAGTNEPASGYSLALPPTVSRPLTPCVSPARCDSGRQRGVGAVPGGGRCQHRCAQCQA